MECDSHYESNESEMTGVEMEGEREEGGERGEDERERKKPVEETGEQNR